LSLFEKRDPAGITTPEYPGERLILCRNPELSKHRAKKREELLSATEAALMKIAQRVKRAKNPLSGKEKIGLAIGKVIEKYKMSKPFALSIEETAALNIENQLRICLLSLVSSLLPVEFLLFFYISTVQATC
jgi:hypothetical protein